MRRGWRTWAVVPASLLVAVASQAADNDTILPAASAIRPKTVRIGGVETIHQDPSIDASDTVIYRTHTRELKITGSGFNHLVRPILEFDPPLDSAKLHVVVVSPSVMHLGLSSSQPAWMPAEKAGPLKIKGIDTGVGMVGLDPPVAVATVLRDSDAHERDVQDGAEIPPLLPAPMPPQPVEPEDGVFSVLSQDSFDCFIQAECECTLVLFYTQSGGYRSPEALEWKVLRHNYPAIKLGMIDMSHHANQPVGVRFGVDVYPTAVIFKHGLKARAFDFSPKNRKNFYQFSNTVEWAMHSPLPEPEGSAVFTLSEDTIEAFTLNEIAVVEFFSRSNAESKTFFPAYTNASIELKSLDPTTRLGKIDISVHPGMYKSFVLGRFGALGFPVLVTFRNGVESSYYMGPPNATDIVEYVLAENPMEQPLVELESGDGAVSFFNIGNDIGDYIQADFAVVEFHVVRNYGWGRRDGSPEYSKAAIQLQCIDPNITLRKVDVRGLIWGSMVTRFHVRGIPAIKIFRNGLLVSEYKGTRDATEIVEYVKAEKAKEVNTAIVWPPSVEASSQVVYMKATRTLFINGANFNLGDGTNKLHFDSPLLLDRKDPEVISSTRLRLDNFDSSWLAESGPLKLVAIDTGAGLVHLNPGDGGVVVAVVKPDVTVQDNQGLYIYPSTKQVQVTGFGFEDKIKIQTARTRANFTVTGLRADQLTLNLVEGSRWSSEPSSQQARSPKPLEIMGLDTNGDVLFRGAVATVLDVPSFDTSDIEIYRTDTQRLVLRGSGFNKMARPILEFDPPLDSAKLHVNVQSPTVMHLGLSRSQPEWAPADFSGPLKIKGIDAGAGMVMVDPPVAVATVLPNSNELRESTAAMTTNVEPPPPPPSIEAAAFVEIMGSDDGVNVAHMMVHGVNFDRHFTRLYLDPPIHGYALAEMKHDGKFHSSTQMDFALAFGHPGLPLSHGSSWPLEPGLLKIVACDTGSGLVYVNPDSGGVVVEYDTPRCVSTVTANETLNIYQSTKTVQVAGSCFSDNMEVMFCGRSPIPSKEAAGVLNPIAWQPDHLTFELPEGQVWLKDRPALPQALNVWATSTRRMPTSPFGGFQVMQGEAGRKVAMVFGDPGIDASDAEIYDDAHDQELEITGTGFNFVARPLLDFDPPLDLATITIEVINSNTIRVRPLTPSGWKRREQFQGPLMVKGVDTGAGLVVLDPPVTVATFVADSEHHEGVF